MKSNEIVKNILINTITIILAFSLGIIIKDYWLGPITLACGFLNAYYMAIGKWQNYIYGLIFSIMYAISCYINGLYGFVIFTILVYTPTQIFGMINWKKNKQNDEVLVKSITLKKALITCLSIVILSFTLGYLLSLIPTQNLAFLDSTSQIINLCGVLFVILRYREAWYIWVFNNTIDISIWTINLIKNSPNSLMMLLVSIMYLLMNIYGVICWIKLEHKQNYEHEIDTF